jgi:hypothetical protein
MIPYKINDQFIFAFPKNFIPEFINEKYRPYIERLPTPLEGVTDYVNFCIQGITFPAIGFNPVTQIGPRGYESDYRSTLPAIQDRTFTVTLQHTEGFISYFILMDLFFHYYSNETYESHIELLNLRTLDFEGHIITTITFKSVLFNSLADLQFNYSDTIQDFSSFDVQFTFNEVDIKLEID